MFRKDSRQGFSPEEPPFHRSRLLEHAFQIVQLRSSQPIFPRRGKSHFLPVNNFVGQKVGDSFLENKLAGEPLDLLGSGNPLFVGSALQQSGAPFTNASFNGFSVFNQTGLTGGVPDVLVGRMTFDGEGAISIGFDQNAGGSILIGGTLTGRYAVSTNGRTTLNLVNPKLVPSIVTMYAISKNTAFIMDYNSASVHSGYLEFQAILPPFGDDNLNGSYPYVSSTPAGASVALLSAIATFDGNGNVAGNEDEDFVTGPNLSQLMSGIYQISPVSKNGRGVIQLSSPQSQTIAVWMATYSRAYAIPVDASDVEPSVITIEF